MPREMIGAYAVLKKACANVNLASLNLDAWENVFSSAAGTPAALTAPVAGASQAHKPSSTFEPRTLMGNGKRSTPPVFGWKTSVSTPIRSDCKLS